jgi:hypothetical protein
MKHIRNCLIAMVLLGVGAVMVFYVPGLFWWRAQTTSMVVAAPAYQLALAAEKHRSLRGEYPAALAEFRALTNSDGFAYIEMIQDGAARIGRPLPDVICVPPDARADQGAMLVLSGPDARVEIYPGGQVGLSENLAGRMDNVPDWVRVVDSTVRDEEGGSIPR